jgi:anti-sigma regulatory factor (Ser/Thr protein kinase)
VSVASRDIHLRVPAKPGYLVLARLALSAICRLTPLEPTEVADLKLAITEAASDFVGEDADSDPELEFTFRLSDDRLELELTAPHGAQSEDPELSRAIVQATVDEAQFATGRTVLVKRLTA